jgi:hypothetical protein
MGKWTDRTLYSIVAIKSMTMYVTIARLYSCNLYDQSPGWIEFIKA